MARALPDAWAIAPTRRRPRRPPDGIGRRACAVRSATTPTGRPSRRPPSWRPGPPGAAPPDGRALFAANAALDWPTDPLDVLWHAATLLREHRGDGHVALLTAARLSGRESNVFQAAAGNVPREMLARARDYDEAEWSAVTDAPRRARPAHRRRRR